MGAGLSGALLEDVAGLLRELVAGQARIVALLEQQQRALVVDEGRPQRFLYELSSALSDLDLPFDAAEILDHAAVHAGLDAALHACGARTPAAVGVLLRSLRDRSLDGFTIVRDGRSWRLLRT